MDHFSWCSLLHFLPLAFSLIFFLVSSDKVFPAWSAYGSILYPNFLSAA
nr:MAG TPA: hypothetical protein [Caudoviricetes sp.]